MINPPWYQDAVEQTAFNAYVYDQEENKEIVINSMNEDADIVIHRDALIEMIEEELKKSFFK